MKKSIEQQHNEIVAPYVLMEDWKAQRKAEEQQLHRDTRNIDFSIQEGIKFLNKEIEKAKFYNETVRFSFSDELAGQKTTSLWITKEKDGRVFPIKESINIDSSENNFDYVYKRVLRGLQKHLSDNNIEEIFS